jgi:hypothetical protein
MGERRRTTNRFSPPLS